MRIVILFGGGDGGGLIITDKGVRPIPPFNPDILRTVHAAAAMVGAARMQKNDRLREKMAKQAQGLCNLAIEQIEEVVGPLDGERGLIYQDDDDGFYCGSTGKPPTPFPWPPSGFVSVADMIAAGAIEVDLVRLVKGVHDKGLPLTQIFESPNETAKQIGVTLSDKSARDLMRLSAANIKNVTNGTEKEVMQFFHTVVSDGRFLDTWLGRPYEVSKELGISLSDAAINTLMTGGATSSIGTLADDDSGSGWIAAGIVWAGVCIVVGIVLGENERPLEEIISDRSLVEKF